MEFSAGPAEGRSRGGRRESGGGVWVRRRGAPGVPAKAQKIPEKATGVKKSPAGRKKPTQKVTSPHRSRLRVSLCVLSSNSGAHGIRS